MPNGYFNIHWFSFFNALTFQIILGAPLILYVKSLGASSTILGLVASFTPLATVLQLPAAKFLHIYGYRRFVLMGWGPRTVLIFFIAAIPVLGFWDNSTKLGLIIATLLVFSILRGAASAAWMPWIAGLIPEELRTRFLSRDQAFMFSGCFLALVASAFVLQGNGSPWAYAAAFLFSGMAGTIGLVFMNKIPDVKAVEELRRSAQDVPWRAMLGYQPFFSLLLFNLFFVLVVGSLGVFTIEFLHTVPGFNAERILYLSGISFLGSLFVLPLAGRLLDRMGNRAVLMFALSLFGLAMVGWFLIAAGIFHCSWGAVAGLNFLAGAAGALFNVANARLAFATMPAMGRNHFFAMFTVVSSLGLGAAPVFWGISLDFIGTFEAVTGDFCWKRHSIYFVALFVLNFLTILQARHLDACGVGADDFEIPQGL